MKTLKVTLPNKDFAELVIVDKIVRISKAGDGETSFIHLSNGETLEVEESVLTLEARLNNENKS